MTDDISQLDTFSRLKASVESQTRFYDAKASKHVRFSADKGVYLHRGLSGSDKAARAKKREAAGNYIWKAIAFEHSTAAANAVFQKVLGGSKPDQEITLRQLKDIDKELQNLKSQATVSPKGLDSLTPDQQVARLTQDAKKAIRDSDRHLYSAVFKAIRDAPAEVRNRVVGELKIYEQVIAKSMASTMERNLRDKGLALVSETHSIVHTRTANLIAMLDPSFRSTPLSGREDAPHDPATAMGALRNEFNRQNVHANVPGKTRVQGMQSAGTPEFIGSRPASMQEEARMIREISRHHGRPEFLMQSFFMPWQDHQGSRISHSGKVPDKKVPTEGRALLKELSAAAARRVKLGLPPMRVKILVNDPSLSIDDRDPSKQSMDKLKQALAQIDPRGAEVEIWGAAASKRGSHHKKMTVAVGGKGSEREESGVLVMTGNHDSQQMTESGVKLTGRSAANEQRKQFYEETLSSGRLLASNSKKYSTSKRESRSKRRMQKIMSGSPPRNDRNAGDTLMAHQGSNPEMKSQFRISEPYALIKSGIRSAKSKIRIAMPYFQLLDLNEEIKGALARGVDVEIVLAPDRGGQEILGQSNRESARDLAEFRDGLARFHGDDAVGKLSIGWFQPTEKHPEFNPDGFDYSHQKFVEIDGEATLLGSFNTDYQSMHSAEQMVAVESDASVESFWTYMTDSSIPHTQRARVEMHGLPKPQELMRKYMGPRTYQRLGLNSESSKALPMAAPPPRFRIESTSESFDDEPPSMNLDDEQAAHSIGSVDESEPDDR